MNKQRGFTLIEIVVVVVIISIVIGMTTISIGDPQAKRIKQSSTRFMLLFLLSARFVWTINNFASKSILKKSKQVDASLEGHYICQDFFFHEILIQSIQSNFPIHQVSLKSVPYLLRYKTKKRDRVKILRQRGPSNLTEER